MANVGERKPSVAVMSLQEKIKRKREVVAVVAHYHCTQILPQPHTLLCNKRCLEQRDTLVGHVLVLVHALAFDHLIL